MSGYKLDQAKQGIVDFAKDAIRKEYLVGLIKFDSSAKHICEPTKDIPSLEGHLKNIHSSGSTNMTDAIKMAHDHLKHLECSRAIVIATDGQPNNVQTSIKAGQLAKRDGIDIITIGTDDADQEFLKKLASLTDLGVKVAKEMFANAIASASNLLLAPKTMKRSE
jgi:Mg-chelatase subunit ChlD